MGRYETANSTLQQLISHYTRTLPTREGQKERKVEPMGQRKKPGASGTPGPQGARGPAGARGPIGRRGPPGLKGLTGPVHNGAALNMVVSMIDQIHRKLNDHIERIAHVQRQIDGIVALLREAS